MKIPIQITLVVVSSILFSMSGCTPVMERNDCGISEREAKKLLGAEVKFIEKKDPLLNLSPSERSDPRVKACGFQADDGSFIYLQQNEYASEDEAKQYYAFAKDFFINIEKKNASDYWEDDLGAVFGEGYKVHAYHNDGLHFDVAGRVGKNAFTIRSNGAKTNKTFSHLMIKGFAVSVGYQYERKTQS